MKRLTAGSAARRLERASQLIGSYGADEVDRALLPVLWRRRIKMWTAFWALHPSVEFEDFRWGAVAADHLDLEWYYVGAADAASCSLRLHASRSSGSSGMAIGAIIAPVAAEPS